MYLTKTTKSVFEIFEKFDSLDNITKYQICIILFEQWSNKLINEKNEVNPSATDEDYEIFTPSIIGLNDSIGTVMAQMLFKVMNLELDKNEKLSINDCLSVDSCLAMELNDNSKKWLSIYEKLSYIEKMDVLSETVIRYDNETLFEDFNYSKISSELDGYEIARIINKYKEKIINTDPAKFPYEII